MIRYLLGDSAVRVPARRCACGRGFELMQGHRGRSGDVVVTPGGTA
jgi:phenylacetate-coenzyme A ligase PaaK-like adenylate-forming protein